MPRKPNNDPAVLLERANKQRERWSKAQTTYLERPENKEKHKEAVNSYYERNKEKLRKAANERNAKKREANKPATAATEIKAEPEMPKENVMEKAVAGLRTVETETKKRNRNRKVAAQLQQVVADTKARNAERKREMTNRSEMAKEEKDASAHSELPELDINIVEDEPPVKLKDVNPDATVEEKRNAVIEWLKQHYKDSPYKIDVFTGKWTKTQVAKIKKWNGKIKPLTISVSGKVNTNNYTYLIFDTTDNQREKIRFG